MVNFEPNSTSGEGEGATPNTQPHKRISSRTEDSKNKNPFGLGDPNDRFLRKVEKEILVPKKMRDRARNEKCTDEVAAFTECCKNASFAMLVTCRKQTSKMKTCLTTWYQDPVFKRECEEEYLKERSEYRKTGIKQKYWNKEGTENKTEKCDDNK